MALPLSSMFIGYLFGECQFLNLFDYDYSVDSKITYTPLEYTNYATNIATAFLTFAAVVIALFKESIVGLIWHPRLEITVDSPKGFSEELNEDAIPLKANSYKSTLVFENKGNSEAGNCELYINEIKTGIDVNHLKTFKKHGLVEPLKWGEGTSVDIPQGKARTFEILEIMARTSTPTGALDSTPLAINIKGTKALTFSDDAKVISIEYCLKHNLGRQENFTVFVEWTGKWHNRKTEMNNCLNVSIKK